MKHNKLLIISADALNRHDLDFIRTLPNFGTFFTEGAHVKDVLSVYPSLTYTCHTSIMTGHYPDKHGVYNNEYAQPHKATAQDWRWFEKDIKVPSLFDYATKAKLTTACVLWPVMGSAQVTYNVPEIWSPDHSVPGYKLVFKHGTRNMILPILKHAKRLDGIKQPNLDHFSEAIATYLLAKKKPDLMAVHFTELDTMRHLHGLHSKEAKEALISLDYKIGHLIQILQDQGLYHQTNIVVLGDHGTHDFDQIIEINSQFKKDKLLTVNNGVIDSYIAYACGCGGSCQIHIHRQASPEDLKRVEDSLGKWMVMPKSPIKALYKKEDIQKKYRLNGDFSYVLEAKDGHVFRNTVSDQLIHPRTSVPGSYKGDHGYQPDHKDMHTLLLMKGPGIKKGAVLEQASLIDEGPTFARLLGLSMEKVDGRILMELLK